MRKLYVKDGRGRYREASRKALFEAVCNLPSLMDTGSAPMTSPSAIRAWLRAHFADLPHEIFGVMFLDNRHRLIANEDMFRGTIDGTAVYPREVVAACLKHNAAAVVFYHNHPSGEARPSEADKRITRRLKSALELIDVRTLDHFVVGDPEIVGFAERGLLT